MPAIADSEAQEAAHRAKRALGVHFDNAPIHTAEAVKRRMRDLNLVVLPHPPYSPDLAPSDFYLFGKLKNCAKGLIFEDENDVVEWVRETFQNISNEELQSVFTEWIKRLRKCIEVGGDYIE